MDAAIKFSCVIDTTDKSCPLGLEIWLDGQQIFDENHVNQQLFFDHTFSDSESDHELKFSMKGKLPEHTKIGASGEILSDARLLLKDFCFEEIALGHVFTNAAVYNHNYNGTGHSVEEKFYGEMGCNGTVSLKFTTPLYLWLLENM